MSRQTAGGRAPPCASRQTAGGPRAAVRSPFVDSQAASDLKTQSDVVPDSCENVILPDGTVDDSALAQCTVDASTGFAQKAREKSAEEHSY